MALLRRLTGDVLRRRRTSQGKTLREVSAEARVSLGYLSEVERGRKEASSELLGSICDALGLPLSDVLREVSDDLERAERVAAARPLQVPPGRTGAARAPRTPSARTPVTRPAGRAGTAPGTSPGRRGSAHDGDVVASAA